MTRTIRRIQNSHAQDGESNSLFRAQTSLLRRPFWTTPRSRTQGEDTFSTELAYRLICCTASITCSSNIDDIPQLGAAAGPGVLVADGVFGDVVDGLVKCCVVVPPVAVWIQQRRKRTSVAGITDVLVVMLVVLRRAKVIQAAD